MAIPLNILVIGPKRSGKSSFIASMISCLKRNTSIQLQSTDDLSGAERLIYANRMCDIFTKGNIASNVWEDDGRCSTKYITSHEFSFYVGVWVDLKITEVPGMMLDENVTEVEPLIRKSQVVFITIDTPILMEGEERKSRNNIQTITDLLISSIANIPSNQVHKQQIQFIPLKCEKYFQSNSIAEINATIKDAYEELIDYIHTQEQIKAFITPAQTIGDLVFDHFYDKKAYYSFLSNAKYNPKRCEQSFLYALDFMLKQHEWITPEEANRVNSVVYEILRNINYL